MCNGRSKLISFAVLLAMLPAPIRSDSVIEKVYTIPAPEKSHVLLEDVGDSGLVLLNAMGEYLTPNSWTVERPKIIVWNLNSRRVASEVYFPDWPQRQISIARSSGAIRVGPLQFVRSGKGIVGIEGPWLFFIDLENMTESFRQIGSTELSQVNVPANGGDSFLMAATHQGDSIAAVLNHGETSHIFTYEPDLKKQRADWNLSRAVKSMSWSQDGRRLLLLLHGPYDKWWHKDPSAQRVADVEVLDAFSGKPLLEFSSGALEAKAVFGSGDKEIYCISEKLHDGGWSEDKIRVFSSEDGHTLRSG